MNRKLDVKLHEARVKISNALNNPEIGQKMALYRYDQERLLQGKTLYEKVERLQAQQQKEYGDQYQATDALESARAMAHEVYIKHVKIARIALAGHRGLTKTLQLKGPRKKDLPGWLKQTQVFYTNIGQAIQHMEHYGITTAELEQAQAMIEAVRDASVQQKKEMAEALRRCRRWISG